MAQIRLDAHAPRPCRRRRRGWPGPSWRPERCISCSRVVRMRAPEAPIGWPMAMAPPLTLTLAGSRPSSRTTLSDWAAKASLDSIRSRSATFQPAFSSALRRGRDRAGAHDLRIDAGVGPGGDAGQRLQAPALGLVGAHQHQGRGAVVEARGVGGGHRAVLGEGGPQAGDALIGDAVADVFVLVDDGVALAALDGHRGDLVRRTGRPSAPPRPCSARRRRSGPGPRG